MGGRQTDFCSFPDNSLDYRMMLRFRPIAPKPIDGQANSTHLLPEKTDGKSVGRVLKKKKYAGNRKNSQLRNPKRERRNRKSPVEPSSLTSEQGSSSRDDSLVTLQLLPKRSDDDKEQDLKSTGQVWCSNAEDYPRNPDLRCLSQSSSNDFVGYEKPVAMIESRVIVERVLTKACMELDGLGLGFSDVDKINKICADPCPGFVSDFSGKVQWVNEAFKKLVISDQEHKKHHHQATELGVELVVKQEYLPYWDPSFACTVRFEYVWDGHKCSRVIPCDVWRMDFGGFAWKLDINASLSLGLQTYAGY
ncbi:uncharacterized protein LOC113755608 [Coffea eugenioides]|uniref:uncharacterized protein LOC113752870 n=1 Tax=Coffea eugenioides TaxID=49369 RepID=UPI000F610C68|nr:uncharacterized protein LOC113752870 [Coffea eugenioides]XP_027155378.1 uncharacterized protein LOC113755608 [Coffea eugenioides]